MDPASARPARIPYSMPGRRCRKLRYEVLATVVPRLEVYAHSFGLPVPDTGRDVWRRVARELIGRCAQSCRVRS